MKVQSSTGHKKLNYVGGKKQSGYHLINPINPAN